MPTHLFKVILASDSAEGKPVLGAFIVPNVAIPREINELEKYQVSIDHLETLTGFTFHPDLSREQITNLCTHGDNICILKSWKELEIYYLNKKVEYARSHEDLDEAMAQLRKHNIKPDQSLLSRIDNKRAMLKNNPQNAQQKYREA